MKMNPFDVVLCLQYLINFVHSCDGKTKLYSMMLPPACLTVGSKFSIHVSKFMYLQIRGEYFYTISERSAA